MRLKTGPSRIWLSQVKDLAKDYKGNRNQTDRSQYFSSGYLNKGLYYRHKGKRYATEAKHRRRQDNNKGLEAEGNSKKALKPKED